MISLCVVAGRAGDQFLPGVVVPVHFVGKWHAAREIDQMADAQDLDEVNGEAADAAPRATAWRSNT